MNRRANVSWSAVGAVALLVALGAGGAMWWSSLEALDRTIGKKRSSMKRLQVAGRLLPTAEVSAYLAQRTAAFEERYQAALTLTAVLTTELEGTADPQLYFQQRVHEVQRTLERLAAAKQIEPPTQLGLPKELPPPEVVPRLLIQLKLIEEAAELIVPQGIAQLVSVKLDDPEAMVPPAEAQQSEMFLTRLPIRLRLTCSLEVLTKLLGLIERVKPMMDLQSALVKTAAEDGQLDVELILARYLVSTPEMIDQEDEEVPTTKPSTRAKPPGSSAK